MRNYFDEEGNAIRPPWIPTLIIVGALALGWFLEATGRI